MIDLEIPGNQTERVRLEIIGLLARTTEVDLGTIYRALMDLMGREIVADIGIVISRMVREGSLEIETRRLSMDSPHIGFARLTLAAQPPYHALVA